MLESEAARRLAEVTTFSNLAVRSITVCPTMSLGLVAAAYGENH